MTELNILANSGLDQEFGPFRNDDSKLTAAAWAPWWLPPRDDDPSWKNRPPVFGPITLGEATVQSLSSPFATHTAGLLQQAPAAPGSRYLLTVEGQAWSSEDDAPGSLVEPSDANLQVGLDPTGGLDPTSPLVIWSNRAQPIGRWERLELAAEAQTSLLTVYLRSAPALPKRQQWVYWRNASLSPAGRYKRGVSIVGAGDTHINLEPEQPQPGERVTATVSSLRNHVFIDLAVRRPDNEAATAAFQGASQEQGRTTWRYQFGVDEPGLYDVRFVGDRGARLLAQQLVRVEPRDPLAVLAGQLPSGRPRLGYRRVYVLLPPTADMKWLAAAARGSFDGRFTVGFSADDAGLGELDSRHVLAVNPHHWPETLTATWFHRHYPGTRFTAVIANSADDLERWLRNWSDEA